jgi:hypothetical protein
VELFGGVSRDRDDLDPGRLDAVESQMATQLDALGVAQLVGSTHDVELDTPELTPGE